MGNANNGNRSNVDRELGRMDQEYNPFVQNARGSSGDFGRADSTRLRDETLQGFRGTGGYNPYDFGGSSNGGGSSYGGDVGWNNSAMGDTGSARAGYEDFARGGGVDATAMRRANTIIPSFYKSYKDSAARRANTQGGYSPGFDAQQEEIGRAAGREGFNSARETEGDIARLTQSGRLAGLGGLTNLGGMETQNNQFNTSGRFQADEGNANRRQSAGQFDRGMDMERARFGEGQRQFGAEFGEGQRRFNSTGIAGIQNQDNENYYRNQDNYLRGVGGRSGNAQNLIFGRTEPTSNFSKYGGMLLGAGQMALGMGGPRRRTSSGVS